jgi:GT2 family glycosyltransferase
MFMRISTLKDVGIFDNNFFAYSEDFDWCLRAGYLGLRLRYVPSATLRHKVSATFNKTRLRRSGGTSSPLAIYLATRNRMYIIRKHAKSGTQFLTAFLIYLVWNIYYGSVLLMLLRIDKLKSLIKGMWHGILTKLIKVENDSRNTLSS